MLKGDSGILRGDGGARVIAAGLAAQKYKPGTLDPTNGPAPDDRLPARTYLARMVIDPNDTATTGNHCALDAAAMHFYESSGTPERMMKFFKQDYRTPLKNTIPTDSPVPQIWVTEFGATSETVDFTAKDKESEPDVGVLPGRTPTTQKAWLRKSFALLTGWRRQGFKVGPMIAFNWLDLPAIENPAPGQETVKQGYYGRSGLWGVGGVTGPLYQTTTANRKPAGELLSRKGRAATRLALPSPRCRGYRPDGPRP